jgi:hypothetical protein
LTSIRSCWQAEQERIVLLPLPAVTDNGEPGRNDEFGITSSGYSVGPKQLGDPVRPDRGSGNRSGRFPLVLVFTGAVIALIVAIVVGVRVAKNEARPSA